MSLITITPIPAFHDNYFWLIENENECWVVDPGDGTAVKHVLETKKRPLTGILITHHHDDHVGGISTLRTQGMPVIGPSISKHPLVNDPVEHNEKRRLCGIEFTAFHVPGHTLNHLAYFAEYTPRPNERKCILFCGDTLFSGGCGRLFEGTAKQMNSSLKLLADLPEETLVYCAHEYTLSNLKFALSIEPENEDLINRYKEVSAIRKNKEPSLPSTIGLEMKINPFLRTQESSVIESIAKLQPSANNSSDSIFSSIRQLKDQY